MEDAYGASLRLVAMVLKGTDGQVPVGAVGASDMMPSAAAPLPEGFYLSMDQHGQSRENEAPRRTA